MQAATIRLRRRTASVCAHSHGSKLSSSFAALDFANASIHVIAVTGSPVGVPAVGRSVSSASTPQKSPACAVPPPSARTSGAATSNVRSMGAQRYALPGHSVTSRGAGTARTSSFTFLPDAVCPANTPAAEA